MLHLHLLSHWQEVQSPFCIDSILPGTWRTHTHPMGNVIIYSCHNDRSHHTLNNLLQGNIRYCETYQTTLANIEITKWTFNIVLNNRWRLSFKCFRFLFHFNNVICIMFCIFLLCLLSSGGTLITLRRILQTNRCAEQMFLTDRNKRVEMQRARTPCFKMGGAQWPGSCLESMRCRSN